MSKSTSLTPTAERILDIAERLAQTRGFNGFSYADIAAQLPVTKASLHYHFASKAALGSALIMRYRYLTNWAFGLIHRAIILQNRIRCFMSRLPGV